MLSATALALAISIALPPSAHLARLTELYRAYDLRVPPKDAKLYQFTCNFAQAAEDKNPPLKAVWVGFGSDPGKDNNPTKTLCGLRDMPLEVGWFDESVEIKPDARVLKLIGGNIHRPPPPLGIPFAV